MWGQVGNPQKPSCDCWLPPPAGSPGTACGLPDSVTGRAAATAAGLVNPLVVEANNRMMAFVDFPLDPTFESPALAAVPDGLYAAVLTACSNGELTTTQAAEQLAEGITAMLDRTVAE